MRKLWTLICTQRVLMFAVCFVSYAVLAIVVPEHERGPLTVAERLIFFVTGLATVAFALSLTSYFAEAWGRGIRVSRSLVYRLWIAAETLIGIPVAALCYAFAAMELWIAVSR